LKQSKQYGKQTGKLLELGILKSLTQIL